MKRGFDEKKYLRLEKSAILKRISKFDKLYLEVGGKLLNDFHASRVLPGYSPKTKISILKSIKEKQIIYCINAQDIQEGRIIHDHNLTIDKHAIQDIKSLKKYGLNVNFIVINLFRNQPKAIKFKEYLEKFGFKVFLHKKIEGYPNNLKNVVNGYKSQPYISTSEKLTIVTGAASGSGKMSVALSQIFHETQKGIKTGFAKLETFPIWNLPINHPINLAYEAATADLQDKNMIDPYHKKVYKKEVVNYNRDIENFRILERIFEKIKVDFKYKSPTDMGINMVGFAISNDKICKDASIKEIYKRFEQYKNDKDSKAIKRMKEVIGLIQ